jgi:hypothetical protein
MCGTLSKGGGVLKTILMLGSIWTLLNAVKAKKQKFSLHPPNKTFIEYWHDSRVSDS